MSGEPNTDPMLQDNWAKVELFRWQYGELPKPDDQRKLDIPKALAAMADAIEIGCKKQDQRLMPSPSNVCAVLRFAARSLSQTRGNTPRPETDHSLRGDGAEAVQP